jgi:dTMP kinase
MAKLKQGVLIVFEGIDGTGKSSQLERLAHVLTRHGYDVVQTREPTDGPHGKRIRSLYNQRDSVSLEEELELFIADRRQHVDEVIRPALERGQIVLCDRYFLSSAAYQGAAGLDPNEIIRANRFAPDPDIALVFELDTQTSIRRITQKRGEQPNDFEQLDSLEIVDSVFRQLQLPYIIRIDASGSLAEIGEAVGECVLSYLNKREKLDSQ